MFVISELQVSNAAFSLTLNWENGLLNLQPAACKTMQRWDFFNWRIRLFGWGGGKKKI